MFERFTNRARRVVALAEEQARMLNHDCVGTEHLLLGLIHEGEGVAAKALESLGISLDAVRQQIEEIIGQGQQAPSGHIPFTPRAKKVLELSLREALQLGHNYIGTEHILLGLIREGDGVAAQVLVKRGADLNRVRQRVIQLLHGYQGKEPTPGGTARRELRLLPELMIFLDLVEERLAAVEQWLGTGPETREVDVLQVETVRNEDGEIVMIRAKKEAAAGAPKVEQAASLGEQEQELLASKAARQEQWVAGHPELSVLAERCQQLADQMERLRAALRQHGIDPQDKPAGSKAR